MNEQYESRRVADLRADPENNTIFDPLADKELQELADSIREHGVINAISVRPDGSIIAGEQRWRAARLAGMERVPVIVRDVSDEEVETLRIHENLHRRTLKPSEAARAIRRLFELAGITERKGAGRSSIIGDTVSPDITPQPSVKDIAEAAGVSPRQVMRLNRLADLVPSLKDALDAGTITQTIAEGLAQLKPEEQAAVAEFFIGGSAALEEMKTLRARLKEVEREGGSKAREAEAERLKGELERIRAEKDAEWQAAVAALEERKDVERQQAVAGLKDEVKRLDSENRQLAEDKRRLEEIQSRINRWQQHDHIHRFIKRADEVMPVDARDAAYAPRDIAGLIPFLEQDQQTALQLSGWCADYARHLGERLAAEDAPVPSGLWSVK